MTRFDAYCQTALLDRARRHLLRTPRPVSASRPGYVTSDGADLVDLSSNDYLGLAHHPVVRERAALWAQRHGAGARASRLVTGTLDLHLRIEARLAAFKGCEAAVLFASGWQANASVLPALAALALETTGSPLRVYADRLNHASLHHGVAAAGLRQVRFGHNDLGHLETLLARDAHRPGLRLIATESVFSMDGDRADLPALRALADRFDAFLYVDEAHATGVLGPGGRGLAAGVGVDLVMGTFSKAFGAMGAYVAGSKPLCAWLANVASGFVFS
ncbi:aminotransferase class I/II-fold pyridoxal phosphate-dependent enzyme, partial [Ameyamaea chiangmaiensis]